MNTFYNFILLLFPLLRIFASPWRRLWQQEERAHYLGNIKISMPIAIFIYVAHHFFVDRPLGLTSDPNWIWYRFGLAGGFLLTMLLTLMMRHSTSMWTYKVPLMIMGIVASYFQALSMVWSAQVPYIWSVVIPVVSTILLRLSPIGSLLYCGVIFSLQHDIFVQTAVPVPLLYGACVSALFILFVIRRTMAIEVTNFMQRNELIEAERKVAEGRRDLLEQVEGFLPRVINERISKNISSKKMSVVQSVDDELRPKEKMIVCLYGDIRGFTKRSQNQTFIAESVIPATQESVTVIEELNGIPRVIGDLVFAYFDRPNMVENFKCAILAAEKILTIQRQMFAKAAPEMAIPRYFIITCGTAIVGNIGGTGSAREITALGSCVNKANRIDEFTKVHCSEMLRDGGIVLCQDSLFLMAEVYPDTNVEFIQIGDPSKKIRDFESDTSLGVIPMSSLTTQSDRKITEVRRAS